jgi:hypothetical protein
VRGNGVAVDAPGFLGEPVDEIRAVGDLTPRFRERLALLGGEDAREILLVGHHQVEELAQQHGALLRGAPRPVLLRAFGRRDGAARLRLAAPGHLGDGLAGRRVQHRERLAGIGIDPAAVDKRPGAQQAGILECERHGYSSGQMGDSWSESRYLAAIARRGGCE